MNGIIRLHGMKFFGYHGTFSEEKTLGQKFDVDLELFSNIEEAAKSDDLHKTIDYLKVYKLVEVSMTKKKHHLLESLMSDIIDEILEKFPKVNKVLGRIRKPNVAINGIIDYVEVELEKSR